jgi:hypothetical protein
MVDEAMNRDTQHVDGACDKTVDRNAVDHEHLS